MANKPKLTFIRKDGKTFTKTFKSLTTAKRAVKGWTANGGKMKRKKRK
jgi:hypothetical protein